jgi:hypothetical protein
MTVTPDSRAIPAEWLPKPEDEFLHIPRGDESLPWKDTWYISVRDDAINANINMHMTISANRSPATRVAVGIAQGNQLVDEVHRSDGTNNEQRVGNELAHLEIVNPTWDSKHELRWVGSLPEVDFDITLRGKHFASLWDTMFQGYYATGKAGGQFYCHAEQVVTAEGWLRWKGGPEMPFSGFGWRDRGWGRRKTQLMWDSGWDLTAAILPDDSVISLIALRSHEVDRDAPMPIAGWRSDAHSLAPCIGGVYHKDAIGYPRHLELEFLDGYRMSADQVRRTGTVALAMQEPEVGPDSPGLGACMRDLWAVFADAEGREFPLFTQNGHVHKVDVFRNAEFKYVPFPPA